MIKGVSAFKHLLLQHSRVPLCYCPSANFATSFKDKLAKKQMDQAKEEFRKEMDFLASKEKFTMEDYKIRIDDGLNKLKKGLRAKLMSGTEQTEASLTNQRKILNAFYDVELSGQEEVFSSQKKEIAAVTQTTVEDVNMVIKNFRQLESMHKWIRTLQQNGEPLPADQDDLINRYRRDRPMSKGDILKNFYRPEPTRKKILQRIKWGATAQ